MKYILVLIALLSGASCSTSLMLASKIQCHKVSNQSSAENPNSCGSVNNLARALENDAEAARHIAKHIKGKTDTKDNPPPKHLGTDSALCPQGTKKLCSYNTGCTCIN